MTKQIDAFADNVQQKWIELHEAGKGLGIMHQIVAVGAAFEQFRQAAQDEIEHHGKEMSKAGGVNSTLRKRLKDQHAQDLRLHTLELHLANRNGEIKSLHAKNKVLLTELKMLRETVAGGWDADPASRRIRDALIQAQAAFIVLDEALHSTDVEVAQRALGDTPGHQEPEAPAVVEDLQYKPAEAEKPATYTRCPHDKIKWLCSECCQVEA